MSNKVFYIISDSLTKEVTPNYGNNLALVSDLVDGEQFTRDSLTGSLVLQRLDRSVIDDADFGVEFELLIQEFIDGEYETIYRGTFTKADCEFDPLYNNITINSEAQDKYEKLLSGSQKEFDLIALGINRNNIRYTKQPVLQIYQLGASYVTNFVKGMSWEQEVSDPTLSSFALERDHHFINQPITDANGDNGSKLFVTGVGAGLSPDVSGVYDFPEYSNANYKYEAAETYFGPRTLIVEIPIASVHDDFDDFGSSWHDPNGKQYEILGIVDIPDNTTHKRLYFRGESPLSSTPTSGTFTHFSGGTNTANITYQNAVRDEDHDFSFIWTRYGIYDKNTNQNLYITETYDTFAADSGGDTVYTLFSQAQVRTSRILFSRTSDSKCRLIWGSYFSRIFSDSPTINELPTSPTPDADGMPTPGTYKTVIGFNHRNFVITDNHADDGRFGTFSDEAANFAGEHFGEGTGNFIGIGGYPPIQYLPINRREWSDASHFTVFSKTLWDIFDEHATGLLLRHAYKFHEVIQLLLTEIDDRITFDATPEHSEFLYSGTNPVAGEAQPNLYLTPKSNVMTGSYDRPAEKANIKLSELLFAFKTTYNAGWHVDDDFKLRLEHNSWYENGGSYTTEVIGADLVDQVNLRNQQPISYGQNKFGFDKQTVPERIDTQWMDEVSEIFQGYPIEIKSKYAETGNIDERRISTVSTDLDFATTQPNSMSRDGWFMLATFPDSDNVERVAFKELDLGQNQIYDLQNGHLSFAYLHDKFYRDAMPAEELEINNEDVTANSITRIKTQDVVFNSKEKIDPIKLIKTDLGNGKIVQLSRSLESDKVTAKLRHERI